MQTARDKERRKRKPGPLLLSGFCLPKALQPVLPIYLQGMLQVSLRYPVCQQARQLRAHNCRDFQHSLQGIREQACCAGILW